MKCPNCGTKNSIETRPKSYSCTVDGCGFAFWLNCLEIFGRLRLSESDAMAIIAGQQIELYGLLSPNNGKKFGCHGELGKWISDDGSKIRWGIKLVFVEQQKKISQVSVPVPAVSAEVADDEDDEDETSSDETDIY